MNGQINRVTRFGDSEYSFVTINSIPKPKYNTVATHGNGTTHKAIEITVSKCK